MAKFKSVLEAASYLGSLVRVPRHGVAALHAVRKDGLLECPEGYFHSYTDCEPVESQMSVEDDELEYAKGFAAGREAALDEMAIAPPLPLMDDSGKAVSELGGIVYDPESLNPESESLNPESESLNIENSEL